MSEQWQQIARDLATGLHDFGIAAQEVMRREGALEPDAGVGEADLDLVAVDGGGTTRRNGRRRLHRKNGQ
jgi:hypothetical protein